MSALDNEVRLAIIRLRAIEARLNIGTAPYGFVTQDANGQISEDALPTDVTDDLAMLVQAQREAEELAAVTNAERSNHEEWIDDRRSSSHRGSSRS